jgi:hypothetical protein
VDGTVPFYEVGEMRVRTDTISQKRGLVTGAEALLKLSKEDVLKDVVATEEEVVYRLNAFFMALEMLNICSYSVPDWPIRDMKELASFRKETPGLAALLRVDKPRLARPRQSFSVSAVLISFTFRSQRFGPVRMTETPPDQLWCCLLRWLMCPLNRCVWQLAPFLSIRPCSTNPGLMSHCSHRLIWQPVQFLLRYFQGRLAHTSYAQAWLARAASL